MSNPAIAMPGLDAPNRISLPNEPAPYGAPAPEIGAILQVASDLDKDGRGTDPEFGPTPMARRIGLATTIAIVAFGFGWFLSMLAVGGKGDVATVPAAVITAFFTWLYWRGSGKTSRFGSCVFLGTNGFTRIFVNGRSEEVTTLVFRDDMTTTTEHKDVMINGAYAYTAEAIRFWNADGSHASTMIGTYANAARPGAHALAVRSTITLMTMRRAPNARRLLRQGQSIVFSLVDASGKTLRPTGGALVLDAHAISYYQSQTAQPLRLDRRSVRLALRHGYVDVMAGATVVGTFERACLANYELLAALVTQD